MAVYEDKRLVCRDCGEGFVFSAKDQQYYIEHGFENLPSRCFECRRAQKGLPPVRQTFEALCAQCGAACQLPFQPRGDKPVYCSVCYKQKR